MSYPPRGIANNNPGNIRVSGIDWRGKDVPSRDGVFETFGTAHDGIRALAKNALGLFHGGRRTISLIIAAWAPASENDTAAYVAHVAALMKAPAGAELELTDPAVLGTLTKAIILQENGVQPYDPPTIDAAVRDALGLPAVAAVTAPEVDHA